MATVQIRETTVTPAGKGMTVALYLSDAPKDDGTATFRLALTANVPQYEVPLLAHYQRAALKTADEVIETLRQQLAKTIQAAGMELDPPPRK